MGSVKQIAEEVLIVLAEPVASPSSRGGLLA